MTKYSVILFIILLVISCKFKEDTSSIIKNSEFIRDQVNLVSVYKTMKLDSVCRIDVGDLEYVQYAPRINWKHLPHLYYFVEYYSDKTKRLHKTIYYQVKNQKITIAREEDNFSLNQDTNYSCFLIMNYYYGDKKIEHRIDSFPTMKLITKNEIALDSALKNAETHNWEICGTSAGIILERNFPKRSTIIEEKEFLQYKREYFK